jgi:hypothetical protein
MVAVAQITFSFFAGAPGISDASLGHSDKAKLF